MKIRIYTLILTILAATILNIPGTSANGNIDANSTKDKLITILDKSSTEDLEDAKTQDTFGVNYKDSSKAHSVRIRADGSKLVIVTPKLSEPVLSLVAGKIASLLPEIDLEGAKIEDSESFGNPKNWSSFFEITQIYEDSRLVSIAVDYEIYTGGAHGQHGRLGYVIDKKKKRFVRLNELFHEQRLIKTIGPVWEKQIQEELGADRDDEWIRSGVNSSSDYKSFVLTGTSLIIYGQSYQHNSYAEGEKTLEYPLSKLKNLRKKYK